MRDTRMIRRIERKDDLLQSGWNKQGPLAAYILCILHAFTDKNLICGNSGCYAGLLDGLIVECLVQGWAAYKEHPTWTDCTVTIVFVQG